MDQQDTRILIEQLLAVLTDLEFGYTPNSGYEMCYSCQRVKHDKQEFSHLDDCKWKVTVATAKSYLNFD